MDLFEGQEQKSGDITNVLSEETATVENSGSSAPVNTEDFAISSPDLPEDKKESAAAAPAAEVKTTEKIVTDQTGKTEVTTTVVKTEPVSSDQKSGAFSRAFNGGTLILFADILMRKIGGIANPSRPSEYWQISPQDKADFTTLLNATAQEENWSAVPSKYLLLFCILIMLGGKIMYAKKTEYEFVPGEKAGDPKAGGSGGGDGGKGKKEITDQADQDYKALYTRARAEYEADMGYKSTNDQITALKQQNDLLMKVLEKAKNDQRAGGGISDAEFEEIKTEHNNDKGSGGTMKGHTFIDSNGDKWNFDRIEFTPKGAILDRTKAGTHGYTSGGIKLGNISKFQWEAVHAWRKYKGIHEAAAA